MPRWEGKAMWDMTTPYWMAAREQEHSAALYAKARGFADHGNVADARFWQEAAAFRAMSARANLDKAIEVAKRRMASANRSA